MLGVGLEQAGAPVTVRHPAPGVVVVVLCHHVGTAAAPAAGHGERLLTGRLEPPRRLVEDEDLGRVGAAQCRGREHESDGLRVVLRSARGIRLLRTRNDETARAHQVGLHPELLRGKRGVHLVRHLHGVARRIGRLVGRHRAARRRPLTPTVDDELRLLERHAPLVRRRPWIGVDIDPNLVAPGDEVTRRHRKNGRRVLTVRPRQHPHEVIVDVDFVHFRLVRFGVLVHIVAQQQELRRADRCLGDVDVELDRVLGVGLVQAGAPVAVRHPTPGVVVVVLSHHVGAAPRRTGLN